ncbi:hypothetical protein LEMLEM_LOCUS1675, partial [Lemmus lemmus]
EESHGVGNVIAEWPSHHLRCLVTETRTRRFTGLSQRPCLEAPLLFSAFWPEPEAVILYHKSTAGEYAGIEMEDRQREDGS